MKLLHFEGSRQPPELSKLLLGHLEAPPFVQTGPRMHHSGFRMHHSGLSVGKGQIEASVQPGRSRGDLRRMPRALKMQWVHCTTTRGAVLVFFFTIYIILMWSSSICMLFATEDDSKIIAILPLLCLFSVMFNLNLITNVRSLKQFF